MTTSGICIRAFSCVYLCEMKMKCKKSLWVRFCALHICSYWEAPLSSNEREWMGFSSRSSPSLCFCFYFPCGKTCLEWMNQFVIRANVHRIKSFWIRARRAFVERMKCLAFMGVVGACFANRNTRRQQQPDKWKYNFFFFEMKVQLIFRAYFNDGLSSRTLSNHFIILRFILYSFFCMPNTQPEMYPVTWKMRTTTANVVVVVVVLWSTRRFRANFPQNIYCRPKQNAKMCTQNVSIVIINIQLSWGIVTTAVALKATPMPSILRIVCSVYSLALRTSQNDFMEWKIRHSRTFWDQTHGKLLTRVAFVRFDPMRNTVLLLMVSWNLTRAQQ